MICKKSYLTLAMIAASMALHAQSKVDFTNVPTEPQLLAENFISTNINERDFAISPDGSEIFYTISTPQSTFQTIVFCKKDKQGNWSAPQIAPFAGKFSDLEPAFSPDGRKMYFASNRPLTGKERKDFDIWVVEKTGATWGDPKNIGAPVNTEGDEFYPSVTKSGNLYFTGQYEGGVGREDIYQAQWKNGQFEKPVALDTAVNSKMYEFNAFVDVDEQFILFTSYGRKDDSGGGDLYMSVKDASGNWMPAKNLKSLNSKKLDYCPYVSPDKKILFFTSDRAQLPVSFDSSTSYEALKKIPLQILNGTGNIYWVQFNSIKP